MKLKQIKLAGFKSFVDPTKIPFLKELSAIIGPNGCGKSNVIDAVRWVLGESSAKHLRGDSMLDVVFNGSTGRKPVSIASVELLFDNSLGRFGGQFANYTDIRVKRQISRDGDASYFLNGQKCRRKDVTELFMGTGLGARSYAIIGQGTISRLIESKPQDLRVFIEEAAGISRYKERRRDTEIRIRHTRENLDRLSDIRQELANQLDKLAEQAKTATRYRELKQSERSKSALLHVMRFQELDKEIKAISEQVNQLDAELNSLTSQLHLMKAEQTLRVEHMSSLGEQEHATREVYYQVNTQIASIEQQLKNQQLRQNQAQQQLNAIHSQIENNQQALVQAQQKEQVFELQCKENKQDIETSTFELEQADSELEKLNAELNTLVAQKQSQDDLLLRQQHQLALIDQHHQSQLRHIGQLNKSMGQYREQLDKAEQQTAMIDVAAHQCRIEELLNDNEIIEEQQAQLQQDIEISMQQLAEQQTTERRLLQSIASLQGRVTVLSELIAPHMESEQLWQQLQVKPGWEKAVQLALVGILQQPVVSNELDVDALGFLIEAETITELKTDNPAFSCDANLTPWLNGIHWVKDLVTARQKLASITPKERIFTADGYVLGHGFLFAEMEEGQSAVVMQQQCQRLTDLLETESKQLQLCQQAIVQANEVQQQQTSRLAAFDQSLADNVSESAQLQTQVEAAIVAKENQQQQLSNLQSLLRTSQLELDELEVEQQLEASKKAEIKLALSVIGEASQPTNSKHLLCKEQQISASQNVKRLKQTVDSFERKQQTLTTQHLLSCQQVEQLEKRLSELASDKKNQLNFGQVSDGTEQSDSICDIKLSLTERLQYRESQQKKLDQIHLQQTALQQQIDANGLQQNQQLDSIQTLTQRIGELKIRREGLSGQLASQKQLIDEQDIDIKAVANDPLLVQNCEQIQQELDKTRRAITRLGAINLAAIEEFEQQSLRKNYLDEQDDDLNKALYSLEDAIKKIDKETRSRFKQTFDQVNEGLSQLFPKVFGGGSAYLALTESDLLETGVTIMARPPGKKNSTIHLLSGGEKALTALSLVFAIFRLNPAPFCMLDEVDAPLDDANVERFCRLLKEMSQSVQFIYISHNKITMELADQLIGVTMQEPGVSRIVAVDIDEAVALADAV